MKNTLKNLWFSYLIENLKATDDEKAALDELLKTEKSLLDSLSKNQDKLLKQYLDKLGDLNCICEFNAFKSGITFASRFFIETFCQD